MYRKNSNTWIYIAIGIAVCFILLLTLVQAVSQRKSADDTAAQEEIETETESESELPEYGILIYKTGAGTIEFNEEWLVSETDSETCLKVKEGSLVTLLITPSDGKLLTGVDVTDYEFRMIESDLRTVSGLTGNGTEQMRLNFVMPSYDVIINFNYADAEPETEAVTEVAAEVTAEAEPTEAETLAAESASDAPADETEPETEPITETETEQADIDIIACDSSDASNDSASAGTSGLAAGTASSSGTGSADSGNTDSGSSDSGSADAGNTDSDSTDSGITSSGSTGTGSTNSAGSGTGSTNSTTTSFDILSVSTVFLSYVSDEDAFYQAAFSYVLEKGLTGEIIGTMSGYSIDPENKTATVKILLNTGATITGIYDKAGNTYAFSGL
ncbi:MAG: hypothetical protein LUI87_06725 [Lachnospiraceae bacterium]|nr:hypothetical protein [Lachnospiraceae bacterium]